MTPERLGRGYVIVLPGIEGRSPLNGQLARGLIDSGLPAAVEIDDWTTGRPLGALGNLRNLPRNRIQARRIAERIVRYQHDYPRRPVSLVGHSGGGAISVFVLEALAQLEAARPLHSALLLGAALSPTYDLRTALRMTGALWNFYSPWDIPHLVWGTRWFGTVDRQYGVSAGAVGFATGGESAGGLHQCGYRGEMRAQYHLGGHFGWTNRVFAAERLAPLVGGWERVDAAG